MALAQEMAASPDGMLQKPADTALTHPHSPSWS
jgi:hypothetical protein